MDRPGEPIPPQKKHVVRIPPTVFSGSAHDANTITILNPPKYCLPQTLLLWQSEIKAILKFLVKVDMLSDFSLQIMMQRSHLAWKFLRTIEKEIFKDTSCISKIKIAAVGHIGKQGRPIAQKLFVIHIIT